MIFLYKIIENPCFSTLFFANITPTKNTFQNRILQNPSRISYPFSKTLSLPNLTLWEVVSSLQLAQFRTADPEDFCHQTLCFQTHPIEVHHITPTVALKGDVNSFTRIGAAPKS